MSHYPYKLHPRHFLFGGHILKMDATETNLIKYRFKFYLKKKPVSSLIMGRNTRRPNKMRKINLQSHSN